ncbi:MAG: hypothetical protein RL211_1388 [Pseudomonadota bacterium]
MIAKSHHWQKTAIAASAAVLLGLWGTGALALSLGRITVLSALGEPLRAEVDIPVINVEEAASLKASVAPPDAFRAAGLEYNAAMPSVQVSLQKRVNGRAYLRLSSDRPFNEPFVDLVLEANWASGRIVRDYTLLFDPVSMRPSTTAAQTPAQTPVAASVQVKTDPHPATIKPAKNTAPPSSGDDVQNLTVKPGDTAGKIAATTKPSGVSLDQMLVAMLQANPEAFVDKNMNRIKTGAIVKIPGLEQIESMTPREASQMVLAQSKDFNEFRKKLAANAPTAQVSTADRQASGTVQAKVEEAKPVAAVPDKLTLSKKTVQGQATEAKLAKERAEKEAVERAAEIAKNINDLNKLGATSGTDPLASASAAKTADTVSIIQAPIAGTTQPAVSAPASNGSEPVAIAPTLPASAAKAPMVVPVPTVEPSLIDQLLEDPLVPIGAGGLIALLAGLAFYRAHQRKSVSQVDSSYLESRLQPDSFFGASGGQRVDTKDGGLAGSSMVYSPSQLEAADDVDPVAEADVYLAYGRDLQAEEILKEALRTSSGRIAIHQKLLEIYAKRRDIKGFETIASQAHKLTDGEGPAWEHICELGLGIDPNNDLYKPGGEPVAGGNLSGPALAEAGSASSAGAVTLPIPLNQTENLGAADLDLDLDFSLEDSAPVGISEISNAQAYSADAHLKPVDAMPRLDVTLPSHHVAAVTQPPISNDDRSHPLDLPDLDLDSGSKTIEQENAELARQAQTSFGMTEPAALSTPMPKEITASQSGMLEFDLGSLSLDLDDSTEGTSVAPSAETDDPLVTKLALAEEFVAIGNSDGARSLIEEVLTEATGDVKSRAQLALNALI